MAERLHHRLGGAGGLAIEHALLEENVEKEPADAGEELDDRGENASHERDAAPLYVRAQGEGEDLDDERHQPEREIDHRLVRNEGDEEQERERNRGAERVPENDR